MSNPERLESTAVLIADCPVCIREIDISVIEGIINWDEVIEKREAMLEKKCPLCGGEPSFKGMVSVWVRRANGCLFLCDNQREPE